MTTSHVVDAEGVRKLMKNCERIECVAGWAPNPPKEHLASKLARVCFYGGGCTIATFWLWRENGEEKWHLVSPAHWAPLNASKGWTMTFPMNEQQMCKVLIDLLP